MPAGVYVNLFDRRSMDHARDALVKLWNDPDAEVRQGLVMVATAAVSVTTGTALMAALQQPTLITVALDCTVRGGGLALPTTT